MASHLFDKHLQKTKIWVKSIQNDLVFEQESHALDALRVVLHQLRDNLPLVETAHLSAQLPLIVRGLYFEGWNPSQIPLKERKRAEFVSAVQEHLEQYMRRPFEEAEVERVIRAVLQTLKGHIDTGEWEKLYGIFPASIREFMT